MAADAADPTHPIDAGAARRRFLATLDCISEAFYALDAQWRICVFNRAAEAYMGVSAEVVIGRQIWDIFPQGLGTAFETACREAMASRATTDLELSSALRPGRAVKVRIAPWDDGVCVAITDVTEQASINRKLAEHEERLRLATEGTGVGIYDVNLTTAEGYWSQRAFEILGLPKTKTGRLATWLETIHPDDRLRVETEHAAAVARGGPWRCEYRIMRGDTGETRWLSIYGQFLPQPDGSVRSIGVVADISESRTQAAAFVAAAQALAQERERLRLALLTGKLGVYEWTMGAEEVWWSPETYALYGVSPQTFAPTLTALAALIHPDDRAEFWAKTESSLATREPFQHQYRIVRPDGAVRWLFNRSDVSVEDAEGALKIIGVAADITERMATEMALRESEARLRAFYDSSPILMGVTEPHEHDVLHLYDNAASARFFGVPDTANKWARADLGADDSVVSVWLDHYAQSARSGAASQFEHSFRVGQETRWLSVTISPLPAAPGEKQRFCYVAEDVTERRRADERTQDLMREVSHRAKNMLAVVQAVARQTAATSPQDFLTRFERRIASLSRSQDLLIQNQWVGVHLADLVDAQLGHFGDLIGERILVSGPKLALAPNVVQPIGMALHELATNAAKYGALAGAGAVTIDWSVTEDPERRIVLSWVERGGPPVRPPERVGFGSKVIRDMIERSLNAKVAIAYPAEGLSWRLTAGVGDVLSDGAVSRREVLRAAPGAHGQSPTAGQRVMIVEDEPLVAYSAAEILKELGCVVVGEARTCEEALRTLRASPCDFAVLDVNLGRETSAAVAVALRERGTPFITLTGYLASQLPAAFEGSTVLAKPVDRDRLTAAIQALTRA